MEVNQSYLSDRYDYVEGSSAKAIDFPELGVERKSLRLLSVPVLPAFTSTGRICSPFCQR